LWQWLVSQYYVVLLVIYLAAGSCGQMSSEACWRKSSAGLLLVGQQHQSLTAITKTHLLHMCPMWMRHSLPCRPLGHAQPALCCTIKHMFKLSTVNYMVSLLQARYLSSAATRFLMAASYASDGAKMPHWHLLIAASCMWQCWSYAMMMPITWHSLVLPTYERLALLQQKQS
jgi:hypothetical protein